ncbi:SMI1/KNR4 family protein [Paenibacillus sp. GCM10028914]|uniref:SMI1/KNR4 family protein n=1 Tax=Paenibacillus sp. GCM10028914 TaxID=3273416 RepID=UPI00361B337B
MRITWERVVGEVSEDIINKVERTYDIVFPKDYRECVIRNNGGHPKPNIFFYKDEGEGVFEHLLSFTSEPNIVVVYEFIRDYMPEGIFPFATDPFGNQLCFDYRKNKDSPSIVFRDHEEIGEEGIIELCDTFSELLETLHEDNDDFYEFKS